MATGRSSSTPIDGKHDDRTGLPKTTKGTSQEYQEKAYAILAKAMMPNPQWRIMFAQDDSLTDDQRLQVYMSVIKGYHDVRAQKGAFVIEAGNFAACALWWPPGSQEPPQRARNDNSEQQGTPSEAEEPESQSEKIDREHIWSKYGDDFWQLGLIGRDPNRPPVAGAVRAVLQPIIDQAAGERKPIWLKTTSEHAKDIYLHFGWHIVEDVISNGHKAWAMLLLPPSLEGN